MASFNPISFCVYGSSSIRTKQNYLAASFELGAEIARRDHICVNGGGSSGCMGSLNEGCRSLGGKIVGIIHVSFVDGGGGDTLIADMIVAKGDDLTQRKRLLRDSADCMIVLPGGVGTFEELWDTVANKSCKFCDLEKIPICLVNINGFYDGFVLQLKRAAEDGLLYGDPESLIHIVEDPVAAVTWCEEQLKESGWVSSRLDMDFLRSSVSD